MEAFLTQQQELLRLEHECELELEAELLANHANIRALERAGLALGHLQLATSKTGLYGRTLVTLEKGSGALELPPTQIRVRDVVQVDVKAQGQMVDTKDMPRGIVYSVRKTCIVVALENAWVPPSGVHHSPTVNLIRVGNDVTYQRYQSLFRRLSNSSKALEKHPVLQTLFERKRPQFSSAAASSSASSSSSSNSSSTPTASDSLNSEQQVAIQKCLESTDVHCIHGPPGTGKTTTVVAFIQEAVARGLRVLACAPSNVATDNICERLLAAKPQGGQRVRVCRLGHPARVMKTVLAHSLDALLRNSDNGGLVKDIRAEMDGILGKMKTSQDKTEKREMYKEVGLLRKDLHAYEKKAMLEVLTQSDVVACTCIGSASRAMKDFPPFDVVVIDEAAQALEIECLMPILRGKRVVLAGDHNQLPPTIMSPQAAQMGLERTLFERLALEQDGSIMTMLTTQYRMHHTIMAWSSGALYENKLRAGPENRSWRLLDLPGTKTNRHTSAPFVLIDTDGFEMHEDTLQQQQEEKGQDQGQGDKKKKPRLGLQNQSKSNQHEVELVMQHCQALLRSGVEAHDIAVISPYNAQVKLCRQALHKDHPQIEIGTVDGFQGREKQAVVISCVRSNEQRNIGFLRERRRMNVAITRAKRHVCVIADCGTVRKDAFLSELVRYCEEFADVRTPEDVIEVDDEEDVVDVQEEAHFEIFEGKSSGGGGAAIKPARKEVVITERDIQAALQEVVESKETHTFSNDLNSFQRMHVHTQVELLNLRLTEDNEPFRLTHYSSGKGRGRKLTVLWESVEQLQNKENESQKRKALRKAWVLKELREREEGKAKTELEAGLQASTQSGQLQPGQPPAKQQGAEQQGADKGGESSDGVESDSTRAHDANLQREKDTSTRNTATGLPVGKKKNKKKKKKKKKEGGNTGNTNALFFTPQQQREMEKQKAHAKSKAKGKKVVTVDDDEDLDDLLAEFRVGKCFFAGCKAKIKYNAFTCKFCKESFCVEHMNALFHGCGERKHAAQQKDLAKRMSNLKHGGSGNPTKLSSSKRAALNKKLQEKTNARAITAAEKKKEKKAAEKKKNMSGIRMAK